MSDKTYIEPIYYHDEVKGWHHHHTDAGAIVHLDEASGHAIDRDGTIVVFSAHLADHESQDIDDPCENLPCSFADLHPDTPEWHTGGLVERELT
jgi:hypothetical protein